MSELARICQLLAIAVSVLAAAGIWLILVERRRRLRSAPASRSGR